LRHPLYDKRVALWHVRCEQRRTVGGPDASSVGQVLVPDRQAVQQAQRAAAGGGLVGVRRLSHGRIESAGDDSVDGRVECLHPGDVRRHNLASGHIPAA
jgi:hypothetical protein